MRSFAARFELALNAKVAKIAAMAWYRDLEPCAYFRPTHVPLLAVGWLEPGHEVPQGPMPPADVLQKLARMLEVDVSRGFLGLA